MKTIRIFISSPGDVAEERDRAKRVVEGLRKRYAGRLVLETVLWEELPLTATMTFQDGIEKVILAESYGVDVAVFVLWSRLGSPLGAGFRKRDGTPYRSGTEREFDLMLTAYEQSGHARPQIFAYVRQDQDGFIEAQRGKDTSALSEMIRQRELLETFIREEFHDPESGANLRAYHTFPQPSTFAVRLRQHLRALLDEMAAEAGVPVDQQWEDEPYLGLRAFDLQHAPIFFGREQETGTVLEALQQQQRSGCAFVLLVGGSGSGKSSLVRAGVIPDLIESGDEEGIAWRRAVLTPGECTGGLLPGLARALLAKDAIPELREDDGILQELAADFASAPKQAAQQVRRALQRVSSGTTATHLVLLVDQFEEVFTHAAFAEADIQAFTEALKALAECTRVSILATVRSDFYGRCQQVPALMAMKSSAGQIDLVAPAPAALARIIGRPAQLAGLHFEENPATGETLDQRILADIGNNPEALPLVEFALTQLWENRAPDGKLTFARYEALGGVAGTIGHHAEQVFNALPDAVRAEFAAVFNALVTLNEADDAQPVRRRVALDAVTGTPARKRFVEALTDARLLTSDRGELFVAHEALLRVWERAKDWIEANRDFLRVRAQVDQRLNQSGILVPEDPLFDRAKAEIARSRDRFTPQQAAFIEQAIATAERKQHRARRIRWAVMAGLSVLTILSLIGGTLAFIKQKDAQEQKLLAEQQTELAKNKTEEAETNLVEARANEGRFYLERAKQAPVPAQQILAGKALSYAGYGRPERPEADPFWNTDPFWKCEPLRLRAEHEQEVALAESLIGKNSIGLATPVLLWSSLAGRHHGETIMSVAFSPDGTRLLSGDDKTLKLWDAQTGQLLQTLQGGANSVAFSPDGTRLLSGSWDNTLKLWDAQTGQLLQTLQGHQNGVHSVAFSPDGTRLLSGSGDKTLRLWDAQTGQLLQTLQGHQWSVNSVAFSPDGTRLLSGSRDNTLKLWDAQTGQLLQTIQGHKEMVTSVAFSSDGTRLLSGSWDHTLKLWDALPRHQPTKAWFKPSIYLQEGWCRIRPEDQSLEWLPADNLLREKTFAMVNVAPGSITWHLQQAKTEAERHAFLADWYFDHRLWRPFWANWVQLSSEAQTQRASQCLRVFLQLSLNPPPGYPPNWFAERLARIQAQFPKTTIHLDLIAANHLARLLAETTAEVTLLKPYFTQSSESQQDPKLRQILLDAWTAKAAAPPKPKEHPASK